MSPQEPFPPPEQPVPTNRFGTPIQPAAPQPGPTPAAGVGSPSANPYANPYANPNANTYPSAWPAPVAQPQVFGPPARSRAVWLVPVAVVAAVALFATGIVAIRDYGRAATTASTSGRSFAPVVPSVPPPSAQATPAELKAYLTDPRPSPASVVTASSAQSVSQAMWVLRNGALSSRDLPLLGEIETGSALVGDRERASCGCIDHPDLTINPTIQVSAPRQAQYPATFLAQISAPSLGGTQYVREILVLRRARASTPWQVTFATSADYASPPQILPADSQGAYSEPVPASDAAGVRSLATTLARAWQRSKDTGAAVLNSDPFWDGSWTDQKDVRLAAHRNGGIQANGLRERFTFTTGAHDPVYLAYQGGEILGCTLIHRRLVVTPPASRRILQDADRSAWGPSLPPGTYRRLVVQGVAQTCFETTPPVGPSRAIVVGGGEEYESVVVSSS